MITEVPNKSHNKSLHIMTTADFQELYQSCRKRVHSGVLGYVRNPNVAEDVTAAAFAIAFKKRESFRHESSFFTWVYRIALNQAHANWRAKPELREALPSLRNTYAQNL